jgi:hypothetical protein
MRRKIKRRVVNHKKLSKKEGEGGEPRQKNEKRVERKCRVTRMNRGGRERKPKLGNN